MKVIVGQTSAAAGLSTLFLMIHLLLEVLLLALVALQRGANLSGLQVSRAKTNVQEYGGLLNDTFCYVHACVEEIQVLNGFIYSCQFSSGLQRVWP